MREEDTREDDRLETNDALDRDETELVGVKQHSLQPATGAPPPTVEAKHSVLVGSLSSVKHASPTSPQALQSAFVHAPQPGFTDELEERDELEELEELAVRGWQLEVQVEAGFISEFPQPPSSHCSVTKPPVGVTSTTCASSTMPSPQIGKLQSGRQALGASELAAPWSHSSPCCASHAPLPQ